jgi:hypothetical protein
MDSEQLLESKPWYMSRILWSAFIAIVSQVIVLLGVFTPAVDTTAMAQKINDPGTVNTILDMITVAASLYAALHRVKDKPTALTK